MVGTTTGSSGRSPALTSRMDMMLGASAALSGRVAVRCASPASGIKGRRLDTNVKSGLESAVALLDRADVLNLETLDPDQIASASSANAAATRLAGGVSIQSSQFSSPRPTWWIRARASSLKRVSDCPAMVRWWLT